MSQSRPVIYEPPDVSIINKVVRQTCREIGGVEYSHTDVRDFATFMKHLSSAVARGMNEQTDSMSNSAEQVP